MWHMKTVVIPVVVGTVKRRIVEDIKKYQKHMGSAQSSKRCLAYEQND